MKKFIRKWLVDSHIYTHVKFSAFFKVYQYLFKPEVIQQHNKEVALYKSFLSSPQLIFDIGAYDGHKTAAFASFSKKVVSCEPDPENFSLLSIRFRNQKNICLYNVALSNHAGTETLFIHHNASAFNTLNPTWKNILENDNLARWDEKITFLPENKIEVACITIDSLIQKHGLPDFIKIDVEGYEKEVIEGLSQGVPCISFECLLPDFLPQLNFILSKLLAFNPSVIFNVIHQELLLFPEFIDYQQMAVWLKTCKLHSFDLVAKT
ncbi:MAG: FkbM family methyltransferase [Chitinophagaceae bacterium]